MTLIALICNPENIAKAACDIWDAVNDKRRFDWSTWQTDL